MKNFLFFLFILVLFRPSFAQESSSDEAFKLVVITSTSAFDLPSTFYSRQLDQCIEGCATTGSSSGFSYGLGIEFRAPLFKRFSLISGVSYNSNTYREIYQVGEGGPTRTLHFDRNFSFINIPIKAHLILNDRANTRSFFAEFGFINHLNRAKTHPDPESDISLNNYALSGTLSFGIAFHLEKVTWEFAPFYNMALTSLASDVHPYEQWHEDYPGLDAYGGNFDYSPSEFKPSNLGINLNLVINL
ncbi:MAG: hypothetical protein ED557_05245 [Balneola sp.]|nr:MAG: hypothetical protein ED557_05245 [Balneola sp.]